MNIAECNGVLPENIYAIIKQNGLKQCAIADKSGISRQEFNAMLKNRKIIKISDLISISNALNVPIGDLFSTAARDRR